MHSSEIDMFTFIDKCYFYINTVFNLKKWWVELTPNTQAIALAREKI